MKFSIEILNFFFSFVNYSNIRFGSTMVHNEPTARQYTYPSYQMHMGMIFHLILPLDTLDFRTLNLFSI